MERCIFLAKETSITPYRKGTACPLIDIPLKAVRANDKSSSTFTIIDRNRYAVYLPLKIAPYHLLFRI